MTSFNKFRFQIVLLSIIINVIKSDECSKGQTYYENKCLNCYDPHCEKCRFSSIGSCVSCEKNYEIYGGVCYEKCKSKKNCKICDDESNCILCNKMCQVNKKGNCSCVIKYVTIIICVFVFIVTVLFLLKFLFTSQSAKNSSDIPHIIVYPNLNNIVSNSESDNVILSEENVIKEFNENLIEIKCNDIEKKKCDYCNNNLCNLSLNCGCYYCFDCQKKYLKESKICEKCKKEIRSCEQITCGICFTNKNKISKFKCHCSLVACETCYVKWRKENNFCPACRKNFNSLDINKI